MVRPEKSLDKKILRGSILVITGIIASQKIPCIFPVDEVQLQRLQMYRIGPDGDKQSVKVDGVWGLPSQTPKLAEGG